MNGMTIFKHSIRQVLGNLGVAIRVSGGFWVLLVIAFFVYATIVYLSGSAALSILFGIALFVGVIWGISMIAVVWHRFVLLEEQPSGFIPNSKDLPIWSYFWYGVGIGILVFIVLFILLFIVSVLTSSEYVLRAFDQQTVTMIPEDIALRAFAGIVATILYLRFALILPAVALEGSLTIGDSWSETKQYFGAIAMLAVLLTILNGAVMLVFGTLLSAVSASNAGVIIVTLLSVVFQWFYFMLNISILSTLYGHIVQKREVY